MSSTPAVPLQRILVTSGVCTALAVAAAYYYIVYKPKNRRRRGPSSSRSKARASGLLTTDTTSKSARKFVPESSGIDSGEDTSGDELHRRSGVNGASPSADSQTSLDSGKGTSPNTTAADKQNSGMSDSQKDDATGSQSGAKDEQKFVRQKDVPSYDFEIPKNIVGLVIGTKGVTIKKLMEESGAFIIIREHLFSDGHKICSIEGTREQINACLRAIRRRFPPSRFPDLKLTPFIPPMLPGMFGQHLNAATATQFSMQNPMAPIPPPPGFPSGPVFGLESSTNSTAHTTVKQLSLPETVRCEVLLSSLVNTGHIFLQQPTHPTFTSLSRLDAYMNAVYCQPVGPPPLPRPLEPNIICAAPVLGGWYRAQIAAILGGSDEVMLKFLDYGGYARASASDLKQIRSDFMTLPFQAVECYLADVEPPDGKNSAWSSDSQQYLEQLCSDKVIEAEVVGHSAPTLRQPFVPGSAGAAADDSLPCVMLYTTHNNTKVCVNQQLVTESHARFVAGKKPATANK